MRCNMLLKVSYEDFEMEDEEFVKQPCLIPLYH